MKSARPRLGIPRAVLAWLNGLLCLACIPMLLGSGGPDGGWSRIAVAAVLAAGTGTSAMAWWTRGRRMRVVAITCETLALLVAGVAIARLWPLQPKPQILQVEIVAVLLALTVIALVRDHQAAARPAR